MGSCAEIRPATRCSLPCSSTRPVHLASPIYPTCQAAGGQAADGAGFKEAGQCIERTMHAHGLSRPCMAVGLTSSQAAQTTAPTHAARPTPHFPHASEVATATMPALPPDTSGEATPAAPTPPAINAASVTALPRTLGRAASVTAAATMLASLALCVPTVCAAAGGEYVTLERSQLERLILSELGSRVRALSSEQLRQLLDDLLASQVKTRCCYDAPRACRVLLYEAPMRSLRHFDRASRIP